MWSSGCCVHLDQQEYTCDSCWPAAFFFSLDAVLHRGIRGEVIEESEGVASSEKTRGCTSVSISPVPGMFLGISGAKPVQKQAYRIHRTWFLVYLTWARITKHSKPGQNATTERALKE